MTRLLLVVLLALVISSLPVMATEMRGTMKLRVFEDGVVEVSIEVELPPLADIVNLTLFEGASSIYVVDENGTMLKYETQGRNITVYVLGARKLLITYYTSSLTSKEGAVWTLKFSTTFNTTVVLPEGAVVVAISTIPRSISSTDNVTLLEFEPNETVELSYMIPIKIRRPSKPATQPEKPLKPEVRPESPFMTYSLFAILVIVAIAVTLGLLRRRRIHAMTRAYGLSEEARRILEALRRRGGAAYQFEIARELKLPKTTLWRHVRRLAELGLIEIEKHGRQNYLRLKV